MSAVVSASAPLEPLVIDADVLASLARAGNRFSVGYAEGVRFAWLLPKGWVAAATLPSAEEIGFEPLLGVAQREGQATAVLGFVRDRKEPPEVLVMRGAPAGARMTRFHSATSVVAERIDPPVDGTCQVTAIHALVAAGETYHFLVGAKGPVTTPDDLRALRVIAVGLSLTDTFELPSRIFEA